MSQEIKPVSFAADGHPGEDQLLLALERELSVQDAARVEQHLGNCWSCRARYDEMQRGILAFVEYRERRYVPSLPAPPDDTSGFRDRLRNYLSQSSRLGLLTRVWRKFVDLITWPKQVRWVGAVAAATAGVIFWIDVVVNPLAVSANELLTRAVAAQNPPVSGPSESGRTSARRRVVHQKMQIRKGTQTVVRDFEWTTGTPIVQARWEAQPDPSTWNAPMTAEGFATWRDSLPEKKDTVRRAGDLLTLDTATSQSPIKDAWMVVRAADFHPVEQHLRFTDDQQLDFTELAFQIDDLPPTAADSRVAAATPQTPPRPASPPAAPEVPSAGLSTGGPAATRPDLDDVELQLRYTLFKHQWDLDEDLAVGRSAGLVTLSGIVGSRDREEEMRATLSALPNVRFLVDLPAAAGTPGTTPARAIPAQPPRPLLADALEKAFPSGDERVAFVDRCLSSSDAALSHAWALKRLVDRYSQAEEQLLKPESNRKLLEMLRSHLQELSSANDGAAQLLYLLPAADTKAPAISGDWRTRILTLFTAVQQQDRLVSGLVAGSQTDGQNLATASANLRTVRETIRTLLEGLKDINAATAPR